MEPYKKLANAIVLRAVDDYRELLDSLEHPPKRPKIKGVEIPETEEEKEIRIRETWKKINKLEKFFRSEWYDEMTNISGEDIIKKVRKEVGE